MWPAPQPDIVRASQKVCQEDWSPGAWCLNLVKCMLWKTLHQPDLNVVCLLAHSAG